MSQKIEVIQIQIKPKNLLRFFEILEEPFSMDRRVNNIGFEYLDETSLTMDAIYKSSVSDHSGDKITCQLRFEVQESKELESVAVIFGDGSRLPITPIEKVDEIKIETVLEEIKNWVELANEKVETEKLKTYYIVGRLRTPNCLPDGRYVFKDFTIFPFPKEESSIEIAELSGKKYYNPPGYQCGIYFEVQACSKEHASIIAKEALHNYSSILSLLLRAEIGLDSNLKVIDGREIKLNEYETKPGSRWEINRSYAQRRPFNYKSMLMGPSDFEKLYGNYKTLKEDEARKFEHASQAYRLGLVVMHKHPEISQLAFIAAIVSLITEYPKAICGMKCPYCGEKIEECHREGYSRGFKEFISKYTDTSLDEIKKILNESYGERGEAVHSGVFFRFMTSSPSLVREFITENGKLYPPHVAFNDRLEWLEMMVHSAIINWLLREKKS